jgi:hypothetical protein
MTKKQILDLNKLVPSSLKNETLTSLVSNLFNRFVSEEKSINIDGRVGVKNSTDPEIKEPTLDREINALDPALYFKTGTEEQIFMFEDFQHKLNVLNADTDNMAAWMSERSYNFSSPISYDKLINYANYYWVLDRSLTPSFPEWNASLSPEYYVIKRPDANSVNKLPVKLATTRPINLYLNDRPLETFTVKFTSSSTFTVTSNLSATVLADLTTLSSADALSETKVILTDIDSDNLLGLSDPDNFRDDLCSFIITNGVIPFASGDSFVIDVTYFTSEMYISFNATNAVGKGTITGVISTALHMYIDGVRVEVGNRILALNQLDSTENGIYTVTSNKKWIRAEDAKLESNFPLNTVIFAQDGIAHKDRSFILSSKVAHAPAADGSITSGLNFTMATVGTPKQVNEWQEFNLWQHREDLIARNISLDSLLQAKRPIIEYDNDVVMNSGIDANGQPSDTSNNYTQTKSRLNQIPQFNLYRYDGTFHGATSGLFFYVEDPDFATDSVLHKKVKVTADSDFIFGTGMADEQGRQLFFKQANELKSVWRAGPATPTVSNISFTGGTDKGTLHVTSVSPHADNQSWTVKAIAPDACTVTGSRSGLVGVALTNGGSLSCDDISVNITSGLLPFAVGDMFEFKVHSPISPRYVKKLQDGSLVNYPGGVVGDTADGIIDGAWLTPLRMFQNFERETRSEITFGDLLNHARSVVRNQNGFTGSSLGINNVRNLQYNPGLGGTIREFDSNFPLLASMLIQKDVSPLTILDFAEQQYNVALSSIDQFIINELASYIAAKNSIVVNSIDPNNADIIALAKHFEEVRASDENLKLVFGDTTMSVKNWPATLPALGLKSASVPHVAYDVELGLNVLVHHDGHISNLAAKNAEFDRTLVRSIVARADGANTAGIFSETVPTSAYAYQLWMKSSTLQLSIFDVIDDSDNPRNGTSGDFWFKKSTNTLYEWDAVGHAWVLSAHTVQSRWLPFATDAIRNSLVLNIENKLYNSVHSYQRHHAPNIDLLAVADSFNAQIELARFSAKYNYDTYAPDYIVSNAFTWNYSSSTISGMSSVPARWYDVYIKHFNNPGLTVATNSPHLEPWKLFGFAFKPVAWDATYASNVSGSAPTSNVKVVAINNVPVLFGLQTIDGVSLSNGDRILLTNQTAPQFNGIYEVNSTGWNRASDSMSTAFSVTVDSGNMKDSIWTITTASAIAVGVTPITFEQIRMWKSQMWLDIKAANPTLKLCVNINTDDLLPPYVSTSLFSSSEALLTSIPPNIEAGYSFGQNGPVETLWKKSIEYFYGLARASFRTAPLPFLDKTWGETYMTSANNVRLERNLMAPLPASKFLMHGEKLNIINTYSSSEISARIIATAGSISWLGAASVVFEVTHCANDVTVFSVSVNNNVIGHVNEGAYFDIPLTAGVTFNHVKIDDLGIPFELGEKIVINFKNDIVDPNYVPVVIPVSELGCEGCVIEGTPDVTVVIPMIKVAPVFSHVPAMTKKFKGLGQWFTQLLRFSYIDTKVSDIANAYRGWSLKLAYRCGALIRPDSLNINTTQGYLPSTAFNVVLKTSVNTESRWLSALRIQLTSMGTKKLNSEGLFVPAFNGNTADNWTFRIETYNPQHPLIEYYTLNTAGDYQTFNALNKQRTDLAFKRYTSALSLNITTTPISITGLQNVINFVYGYVDRLEEQGWRINSDNYPTVDAETGRNIDWQLEVEKLIDRVYGGISTGEGHILNPFMDKINLVTPVGLMARYTESNFIDVYSMQAAFDVIGSPIPLSNLNIIRTDEETLTKSLTPIFSAHVFINEYEHVILMNKKISDEANAAALFDSFLGQRINTAYLSFVRQDEANGKPTFDGFFLDGHDVKRNITSSISNMGNYYDADKTFSEETTAEHALALLGFTKKDYFTKIGINDTTQFNFWRGLIQSKGTNMTVDAFVNYKKFTDAAVDEFWAYKVASYGDARERSFPEIKINTGDVTQKFTRLQFYNINNPVRDPLPLYTQIENTDTSRWYSIDDLGKGMKFESQAVVEVLPVPVASDTFPMYIRLNNIFHNGDANAIQLKLVAKIKNSSGKEHISTTNFVDGTMINASLIKLTGVPVVALQPGETYTAVIEVRGNTWLNPSKLSPIKLFDYQENTLIQEIGLWHPAIGIHSAAPLEIVNMITSNDPASYNYTTQTVNNPSYKHLKPWAQREVGQVWWDTSKLDYIPYYDATIFPSRDARHSRWGALAEWASVNLYQWTESNVHPSEWNDLATKQEGSSDIDVTQRASGKVANKKYYVRDRLIKTRPIAWSQAGAGNLSAHPSFGLAEYTKIKIAAAGDILIADKGRLADLGLVSDKHLGGWKNNKPVGEIVIGSLVSYDIGATDAFSSPVFAINDPTVISKLELVPIEKGLFGTRIGTIRICDKDNNDGIRYLRMIDSTGFFEDVMIADWVSNDLNVDSTLTVKFEKFGLNLVITRAVTGIIEASDIVSAASNVANDIFIREAVTFSELIPLPDSIFINDETDPEYHNTEYEWRMWNVPSQSDLSADLASPLNTWLPYLGDETFVTANAAIVALMQSTDASLVLRSGISINRYASTWTDWSILSDTKIDKISDGTNFVSFSLSEDIDVNRLSVYSNGIQINPSGYVITGKLVQVVNIANEGTIVTLLYRAYQPSNKELAFDPAVNDDVTLQVQYKLDYQFTQLELRDSLGNISGVKYYFWVQDKTIPQTGKSMSLVQAKSLLQSGPSAYTIFSRLLSDASTNSAYFDSCAVSGLNYLVAKNNSYKLRFLRNFTLRDDPEELNLKNVHTEWELIRKSQSSKIPKALWDAVTNAVCGEDSAGNMLPAQTRVDYDNKNDTRSRYGLGSDQIFADTDLVKATIINTILNTTLTIKLGTKTISDYISALNFDQSDKWFYTPSAARVTMNLIWTTARAKQINEIFFNVLEDSLACNYEFGDIFKTSLITVSSTTTINETIQQEQVDELH